MSTTSFQELAYKQRSFNISDAAGKAALIIRDIFNTVPAALPFILEPSALLVFANLRAESPYHLIGNSLDDNQMRKLDAVLAKHDIYRYVEESTAESAKHGVEIFSLISAAALKEIPNQYESMKDIWIPLNPGMPFRYAYIEWAFRTERLLAMRMIDEKLPKGWLKDWWAPHNVRFGMLLGYPGEAISSFLWADADIRSGEHENSVMEELVIAVDKQYFGAQVSFNINQAAVDNKSVVSIRNTWQTVIDQIYDAIPLAELLKNQSFEDSYKELRQRETGEI